MRETPTRPPTMLHALIQLVLYALLASFSALALTATVAVLQTGRLKALVFATGFVAGQLAACAACVLVGVAATGSTERSHPAVQATLELVLAAVLTLLAFRVRARGPVENRGASSERARRLLDRLGRLRVLTMLLAGLLFGIGGPKRLFLTALAATSITTAGVGGAGETTLVVWYVALATAIVWAPVILFVFLGERIVGLLTAAQGRFAQRQREVMTGALLALAAFLAIDALILL